MNVQISNIHKEIGEFLAEMKEESYFSWYMFTHSLEDWLTILDEYADKNSNIEEVRDDILNTFENDKFLLEDNTVEIPMEYLAKWYKLLN